MGEIGEQAGGPVEAGATQEGGGKIMRAVLGELGIDARWLDREHAEHAFMFASSYIKPDSYALNPATVSNIDLHLVTSRSVAHAWVKERFPTEGTTQLIYGRDEVCVLDSSVFVERWQDIFVPGRDDAIVLHNLSRAVLFYCHEDEIEIGERCA